MKPYRSATSLVEVVAAMGANAVLAGVAVVALTSLRAADRDVNSRVEDHAALARIAEQIREDLHAAEALTWDEPAGALRLSGGNGRAIEYQVENSRCSRYSTSSNDTDLELTSAFRLPEETGMQFKPANASAGELVHVHFFRHSDEARNTAKAAGSERFIIQVGRDARLLHE